MTSKESQGRFAQLDALRAFAVIVVLIHHYLKTPFFLSGFGAVLFFVLSGYFVTKTLIKHKRSMENGEAGAGFFLKMFYMQRSLRLFPLYYAVLAVTLILGVENAHSSFFWNAAFLSNIQVLVSGNWSGRFSPLWSLSVLEQFYLIWPALVLACPRRHLLSLVLLTVAAGPLYRLICAVTDAPPVYWTVMPFATFDQLGCGGLLALCTTGSVNKSLRAGIHSFAKWVCVPAFVLLMVGKAFHYNPPGSSIYVSLAASLSFILLIERATTNGFSGWLKTVLEIPFLGNIGRMSYSVFLLHNFTELLLPKTPVLQRLMNSDYKALLLIPLTLVLAQLSWWLIESPALAFRQKYIASLTPAKPAPIAPVLTLPKTTAPLEPAELMAA